MDTHVPTDCLTPTNREAVGVSPTEIADGTGLSVEQVAAMASELEAAGWFRRLPDGSFEAVTP